MLTPYFVDFVSDEAFPPRTFFFFYPSLSSSSSSLPPFELESDPLRFELLVMVPFDAGRDTVFGLSLLFEVLLEELPEFDALSLLELSAFWMIFPCAELI